MNTSGLAGTCPLIGNGTGVASWKTTTSGGFLLPAAWAARPWAEWLLENAADDRLPGEPLAALAGRYGLRSVNARPSLPAYLGLLWQRRHFIAAYATARNIAMYT